MSKYLDTSTETQMAQIMSSMEDPVVPLERNLYGHPLAGLLWERHLEKALVEHGWVKVPNWECVFVNRARGLFLSVHVDDNKLAGKTKDTEPTWKILMKEVDLGEPTSFFDHVYLGCTQRECQISKDIADNYRNMFESRISAGAKVPHGLMTWKVMHRNALSQYDNCLQFAHKLFLTCLYEFNQYCHVGNTAQQCGLGLFQDSDFAGDVED